MVRVISADHSGAVREFKSVVSRDEAELFAKAVKSAYHSYYKLQGKVGSRKVKYHDPAEELFKCNPNQNLTTFLQGGDDMFCSFDGAFVDHEYSVIRLDPTVDRNGGEYGVYAKWDPEDLFEVFADEKYD